MTATTDTQMATPSTADAPGAEADQCVVLRGVGWDGYRSLLRLRGDRGRPRMVYLDGDVALMSPSLRHERLAERLGYFVLTVAAELDLPCTATGHTTFRRRKKHGGVEGDKTFYFANAPRIEGKANLHLRQDPPPDLAIEVESTHEADSAVEVWRRFGVPEDWVASADRLRILVRRPDGSYEEQALSVALPTVRADEILDWAIRESPASDSAWLKALRHWAAEVVAPRLDRPGGGP